MLMNAALWLQNPQIPLCVQYPLPLEQAFPWPVLLLLFARI